MDYAKLLKGDVEGHTFRGNQYTAGSHNLHHGGNETMTPPKSLVAEGGHRAGSVMAVVSHPLAPEGRYSVSFKPLANSSLGRTKPVTVAGNFVSAEAAAEYSRAYADKHGVHSIDHGTFGKPRSTKEDMTIDGVPKKNPAPMFGKKFKRRIQGLVP